MEPAHLRPAELLHWNISPETAQDIDTARINVDKYVFLPSTGTCTGVHVMYVIYVHVYVHVHVGIYLAQPCITCMLPYIVGHFRENNIS